MKKLVALASGRGSNFEAIVKAIQQGRLKNCEMLHLICNKEQAGVLDVAKQFKIPFTVSKSHTEILTLLKTLSPAWICLAGYMRILPPDLIREFPGKILNIHPSLLPNFKGLHAQRQAIEAKAKKSGCTVHIVTENLDDGPILGQETVDVFPDDTEETLSARILQKEHALYVKVLNDLSN